MALIARMSGDSIAVLRSDAPRLATVLGPSEPESERAGDEASRFVGSKGWMSQALRAARGTTIPAALGKREPELSSLGAGHGGLADWLQPGRGLIIAGRSGRWASVSFRARVVCLRTANRSPPRRYWAGSATLSCARAAKGIEHRSVSRVVVPSEVV